MPRLAEPQACTGCGACADACAAKAIAFVEDADGFARPQVDAARCRSCGSCTRACPALRADHAVPVESCRKMIEALTAIGRTDVKCTEFEGAGHGIWSLTADTPGFLDWLFSQVRDGQKK